MKQQNLKQTIYMKKELYCKPETKLLETDMEPLLYGTITEEVPVGDGEDDIVLDVKRYHFSVWDE